MMADTMTSEDELLDKVISTLQRSGIRTELPRIAKELLERKL